MAVALIAAPAQARSEHFTSRATFYSVPPCDNQGTITASGQRVRFGVIASDWLPLYTRIRLDRPLHGRRDFQVLDTGAHFDVWLPCGPWTLGWQIRCSASECSSSQLGPISSGPGTQRRSS